MPKTNNTTKILILKPSNKLNLKKAAIIIMLVLILDQALKFWIKTTMHLGQEINVFDDWFILHFTENYGMAFGFQFAGEFGKLFLSIFRIIAIIAIGIYIYKISLKKNNTGLLISMSLIFAGALGNMIDSAFYGLIFTESKFYQTASFLHADGGYGTFLHGKVVDMFYFPVLKGTFPDWFPFWGSNKFIFFRPVFNIADSAITTGVFVLIFFQRSFFKK